jgi:Pyruvate/2-oxoacid:ferredoxin oxidoreductase delta subunit
MMRDIVLIDEEKCDGCGLCVPNCHEGAIQIVNGKARLVADNLCDGLGACLGHCPQDAIRIEKRQAVAFDEQAVQMHLAKPQPTAPTPSRFASGVPATSLPQAPVGEPARGQAHAHGHAGGGCPSQRFARLGSGASAAAPACSSDAGSTASAAPSELAQWPVQLRLLPTRAPIFQDADILLAADCVPFAYRDFHWRMLKGRAVAIACPKLDDTSGYVAKLTEIIAANRPRSITVAHMEVPCCTGILMMALQAREASSVDVAIEDVVVSVRGEILRTRSIPAEGAPIP